MHKDWSWESQNLYTLLLIWAGIISVCVCVCVWICPHVSYSWSSLNFFWIQESTSVKYVNQNKLFPRPFQSWILYVFIHPSIHSFSHSFIHHFKAAEHLLSARPWRCRNKDYSFRSQKHQGPVEKEDKPIPRLLWECGSESLTQMGKKKDANKHMRRCST